MAEIIPSINAGTFAEVQERIAKVEPYVSWCHLDVTDGVFSKHLTWRDPTDLSRLETGLSVEVHLMVEEPEQVIAAWLVEPVKRAIVHLEASTDPETIIRECRDSGIQIGFAIKPDTPVSALDPWLERIDMVCVLRVPPGASGQQIQSEMLAAITHVRNACPACIIEVDGGVTVDNAKRAVDAGAELLVTGAAIFNAPDIAQAIADFKFLAT